MSDEKNLISPVPLPRTKIPVPRPRTKVNRSLNAERCPSNEDVSSSSSSISRSHSVSESDKETPIEPRFRSRSLNRSNIRKSLRLVTTNVQEKGSSVLENTKIVGAKIEKSVRNMLKRNSGASVSESDITSPSETDLHCDSVFSDIKFGSPIVNEERSLPPPYPPPPLPEDTFYDELSSTRSSPPESHYSYPCSPVKSETYYEEIPFLKKLTLNQEAESDSSSSNVSTNDSNCLKSDSWNFFTPSDKGRKADVKTSFPPSINTSSSPSTSDSGRICTEPSDVIHSYENFIPTRVPCSKFTPNVYSEMPSNTDKSGPKSITSTLESVSSKTKSNSIYENWGPIVGEDLTALEISNNTKPLLLHSDTLISEFDPLFKDNPLLQKIYESRLKINIHPFDAYDDDSDDSGKKTNATIPESENVYEMASNCSEGESLADSSVQGRSGEAEISSGEATLSGKKRLARWSSMKEAVRKVYDKTNRRKSDDGDLPVKPPAVLHTSLHTGYLYKLTSMTDNPKNLINKWCTIGEGKLSFCTDKSSVPKDILLLDNIIAIQLILDPKASETGEVIHCWELLHTGKGKPCIVGCSAPTERRIWMQKILEALTQVFCPTLTSSYSRAGWAYLRESSIGPWNIVWLLLQKRTLHISYSKGKSFDVDLRKVINLEFVSKREHDEIVIDTQDKSYRIRTVKELKAWAKVIKAAAVDNGTSLNEQQLTKDNVPTIVEKCVSFVYAHGCMSEGIYRRSGSTANVQRLLTDLRKDAWGVRISQQEYSEHDVSNALKRFFRDLPDPLLTKEYHDYLCNAANIKCNKSDKISMYRNCLEKLPLVNYVTARKLMSHLHYISLQSDKNLMTSENLASIWAPTLMQVQDGDSGRWSRQEFQVIFDLITLFKPVFLVGESEVAIERRIQEVLEKVHKRGGPNHHEPSGNLKIWVYINSKESGDCINISVDPERVAGDVVSELCSKRDMESHECCLQEVCLSGALIRPLHHSESVFQTVIRWAYWHHAHRKDNYLVLTHNVTFKQIAAAIVNPKLPKRGELKYAGPKMKSFKTYKFEFSQAKLYYSKDSKFNVKLGEWPVEDVVFYMGQDPRRTSNTKWSLTLVPKEYQSDANNKEWFGYTLAGCQDDLLDWLSAFHLAQYGAAEVLPRPSVSRLVN